MTSEEETSVPEPRSPRFARDIRQGPVDGRARGRLGRIVSPAEDSEKSDLWIGLFVQFCILLVFCNFAALASSLGQRVFCIIAAFIFALGVIRNVVLLRQLLKRNKAA